MVPFERFNGILGSFQKNWVSPELQMFRNFLTYQDLLLSNVPSNLPQVFCEFFQLQLGMHGEFSISIDNKYTRWDGRYHARCPSKTSGLRVSVSVSDRGKTMTTRDALTSIYQSCKALILLNIRLKTTSRLPTTRKTSKIRHSYSRY